jgi:phosphoheptose isomerase
VEQQNSFLFISLSLEVNMEKEDPREKNIIFNTLSPKDYLSEYLNMLTSNLIELDANRLSDFINALVNLAKNEKKIFVAGNGGSASIADHLCCDFTKGVFVDKFNRIKTQSLNSNQALFTAIANDFGYQHTFSKQLKMLASEGDGIILISSSGNSENVCNAAITAKELGLTSFSLIGFSGGRLPSLTDYSIHIPVDNYGVVEDSHQILMHIISQYIKTQNLLAN